MRADDAMAAAHLLASSLLGSMTDQDLAVLAGRLVPLLWQEGKATQATGNTAYTVASLAAELGVSDKAIRCAIARHELRAVKRGSRWIISSDAVKEWATAPEEHNASARRRAVSLPPAPKAAGPSLRSVLCLESQLSRREVRGGSR